MVRTSKIKENNSKKSQKYITLTTRTIAMRHVFIFFSACGGAGCPRQGYSGRR